MTHAVIASENQAEHALKALTKAKQTVQHGMTINDAVELFHRTTGTINL